MIEDHLGGQGIVEVDPEGEVEIVMYSWAIPLISAPKWLVKTWFPDGPADMVRGIARLAEEEGK